MTKYQKQTRLLAAVDCIIFGFDGLTLKLLLIQRGFEPQKGKWSLMGGFIQPHETFDDATSRVLKQLTPMTRLVDSEPQPGKGLLREVVSRRRRISLRRPSTTLKVISLRRAYPTVFPGLVSISSIVMIWQGGLERARMRQDS